jgi:[protein-PII] uridylyltransferase
VSSRKTSARSRARRKRAGAAHALPVPPTPEALASREQSVAETRGYFELLTRPIIEGRTPKTGGIEFVRSYTRMVDTIVGLLFMQAAEENSLTVDDTDVAVVALGGYGRSELAPFSDVDILVTCGKKTPAVEAVASSFIRLMWDCGFELGHTVESVVEADTALTRDMDTKTALIESRWVCGSARTARALDRKIGRVRRSEREAFLQRKIADALERHEKFGNSFHLIEPNIKASPGGLRDHQTLVWLGAVNRAALGLKALRQKGLLLRGERRELQDAYDFLTRVRVELHLITKSKQDSLTVAAQQELAAPLGYRNRGDHLAVEFFMREYYRHTRTVYRITVDCLTALDNGRNVGVLLGKSRIKRDGSRLNVPLRLDSLHKNPLRVFEKQKASGQKLDRGLRRRLEQVLDGELGGADVIRKMRRGFPALLDDDRNVVRVVRSLHETRFLMKIVPEYAQLTCLKRYDLYHHYTVDEHSFKVLENLVALGKADPAAGDWLARLYSEMPQKRILFLAALLHDIGKIEGHDHATRGAALSQQILARMGLPQEEIDLVCFLVEQHLVMSHFSQRRDPTDIGTITAFCDRVGTRTRLKYLCLLTYADYRATSPLVWNEWKRTLLWELYARAYDFMARREKAPEEVYHHHKEKLLSAFPDGRERERALAHLDLLPGGYLLTMTAEMVGDHMRMIERLNGESFLVAHRLANGPTHEITFCTHDKPFRLSELCGVLAINDFNILNAFAFTRRDGKVIDVFVVSPIDSDAVLPQEEMLRRFEQIRADLAKIFDGKLDLQEATRDHARRWRRVLKPGIPLETRVQFENDISEDDTIIDVFAHDRPGLLFRIARALSEQGLSIARARISTEATRAIDSFYVREADGRKLEASERLAAVRAAIREAIG